MEKLWLEQYPPGVPAEVDVQGLHVAQGDPGAKCARFADLPAYRNMGAAITYRELDRRAARSRATCSRWPAWQGRPHRAHDAQSAAVSGRAVRRPAGGLTVVNTNPLYTRARARTPAEGFGRRRHRRARKLRACAREGDRAHAGAHASSPRSSATCCRSRRRGDQLVARRVKKHGARVAHRGRRLVPRSAGGGRARCRSTTSALARMTTSRSCSTPAARPASPRARC